MAKELKGRELEIQTAKQLVRTIETQAKIKGINIEKFKMSMQNRIKEIEQTEEEKTAERLLKQIMTAINYKFSFIIG